MWKRQWMVLEAIYVWKRQWMVLDGEAMGEWMQTFVDWICGRLSMRHASVWGGVCDWWIVVSTGAIAEMD